MGDKFELGIEISANTAGADKATNALKKVETAAASTGNAAANVGSSSVISGFGALAGGATIVAAGVFAAAGSLSSFISAAEESEAAQLKLNIALQNTGQLTEEVSAGLQDLAS